MIQLEEEESGGGGLPPWMATFADLMSLLMCFFVLLLSFSEMDVLKYKQIAGSMKNAFGVQDEVNAKAIPKGTSIIAQEFSAGRPQPTVVNVVKQQTSDNMKQSLETGQGHRGEESKAKAEDIDPKSEIAQEILMQKLEMLKEMTEKDAKALKESLKEEIQDGKIDIESGFQSITIRIREKGSFASGSATLNYNFVPVMVKIRTILRGVSGRIAVEGHTDNIPISTVLFPSNWHLSAERALSVAHELLKEDSIDSSRFMVVGYSDTKPYVPNDSFTNRSRNRRVEIVVHQGQDSDIVKDLEELEQSGSNSLNTLGVETQNID
jgi:chemotaxis protein MotB